MIFFCRKTSTADGRTRWSVCVPTLMGFTTIAWFYSEALADNFIRHLESNEEDRQLASLDAWREFQFRLDFIWSEKLAGPGSAGKPLAGYPEGPGSV